MDALAPKTRFGRNYTQADRPDERDRDTMFLPRSTIPYVGIPAIQISAFYEEPFALDVHQGFGYAKINIGDRLGPNDRLEILHKLGWGMYATAWLVKDYEQNRYLAMKILTTYGTHLERGEVKEHPHMHEADIMRAVSRQTTSPGAQHCIQLVDAFYITRETGNHLCLLTEVAGMSLDRLQVLITTDGGFPTDLVKLFVKQICLALNYLHTECRVVHTDIKCSNLLLSFQPEIRDEVVAAHLKYRPVRRHPVNTVCDITEETIVSEALPLPGFDEVPPLSWIVKVADFGSAQWLDNRSTDHVQAVGLRAPEVLLGRAWDEKVDIWSLGCMAFELLTGKNLFRAEATRTWSEEEDVLAAHLETHQLTRFPPQFYEGSKHAEQYLNEDGTLRKIPESMIYPKTLARILSVYKVPINLDDPESVRDLAVSFIERCVTLDASERATAAELLQHPWLQRVGEECDSRRLAKRIHFGRDTMTLPNEPAE
ncbi:kinase-like domain-containing protein [Sparassis latifolia]